MDSVSLILVSVAFLCASLIYLQAMTSLSLEEGRFGANAVSVQDLAHQATGKSLPGGTGTKN